MNLSKNSLKLGKAFGIPIAIHWTFFILVIWIVGMNLYKGQPLYVAIWSGIFVLSIFACVLLHELGHALAAKRFGIVTKSIVLLPIGGVASLEKIPEEPKKEIFVALAGPFVNMIISTVIFVYLFYRGELVPEKFMTSIINYDNFLIYLMIANVFLGLFNLTPAFPMDGGRVLRALFAFKMDRVSATELASKVTSIFAIIFVLIGIFNNPMLVFIALFIYIGSKSEFEAVKNQRILNQYKTEDVLMKNFTILNANDTIQSAVNALLNGQDTRFLVQENNEIKYVLTKTDIIKALSEKGNEITIRQYASEIDFIADKDLPLDKLMETMFKHQYSIVPVQENGKIIGVVDLENIKEFITLQNILRKQ
ncbi:MAG: site-2 protease family protein [Bacteroidia bacterium]